MKILSLLAGLFCVALLACDKAPPADAPLPASDADMAPRASEAAKRRTPPEPELERQPDAASEAERKRRTLEALRSAREKMNAPVPSKTAPEPEATPADVPLTRPAEAPKGTLYKHKAFTVLLPEGWEPVASPEQGFEIGFKSAAALTFWRLHAQVMPKNAGAPPSDARTLNSMANSFDRGLRQRQRGLRAIEKRERALPGRTLVNLRYELAGKELSIQSYVYLFANGVAYVIKSSYPKAQEDTIAPQLDLLWRTFTPREGVDAAPVARPQVIAALQKRLPVHASSMAAAWRPTIKKVHFVGDTLQIVAAWPRSDLAELVKTIRSALAELEQNPDAKGPISQAAVDLLYQAGHLMGAAATDAFAAKPPVSHYSVQMIDAEGAIAGTVTISEKDLFRIVSGDVSKTEAVSLYRFE